MTFMRIYNLNKTFKDYFGQISGGIQNVNLEIKEGECIAIIGTNGAGKSTLLNCIHGKVPFDSGEIIINGKNLAQQSNRQKAKLMGRVFQNPNHGTAPRMTVLENLLISEKRGEIRGIRFASTFNKRKKYTQILKIYNIGLERLLDTPIGLLSGGQRQIIALIMATMNDPKLLLLDEHTAALDPKSSKLIMQITKKVIQENKLTTLMVTHQLHEAIEIADRIVILHQGELIQDINQVQSKETTSHDILEIIEALY